MHCKRRVITLLTGLLLTWFAAGIVQAQQVSARVIDRNGSPQARCSVEFARGGQLVYRATTNNDGTFYIAGPQWGQYTVVISQGRLRFAINMTIDNRGLTPPTVVVNW